MQCNVVHYLICSQAKSAVSLPPHELLLQSIGIGIVSRHGSLALGDNWDVHTGYTAAPRRTRECLDTHKLPIHLLQSFEF